MISLPRLDRGSWLLVLLAIFGVWTFAQEQDSILTKVRFDAPLNERSGIVNAPLLFNAKIDINKANFEDLRQIPKLNASVAKAILEKRALLGSFSDYAQIDEIKGVGVKTLDAIRRHTRLISSR